MREHRWSGWGATARGPEHRRAGIVNQDAWTVRRFGDGVAVAVSDGLGSCLHADRGAQAACRAVVEAAGFHLRHSPAALKSMPTLVQHLWELMLSGHSPADCSATCLLVVARHDAGAVLAQLGDGLIAACGTDGGVDLLLPDKSDSFANVTVGLGSDEARGQWRTVLVPEDRYCAFVLCTDGVADDLEPAAVKTFALELLSHYRDYPSNARRREIRRWLREWPVQGHSDDKTIACIYRSEGPHE
jgi:serine/threonine protein phosphatase PrpC